METNPTPQPSDVGEVEKLLYVRREFMKAAFECLFCEAWFGETESRVEFADNHCTDCPVPAIEAAVRTLAGERDAVKARIIGDDFTAEMDWGTVRQLVITELREQLTDAQARESAMRVVVECLLSDLEGISMLADAWQNKRFGSVDVQRKRWEQLASIARNGVQRTKAAALAGAGEGKG